MHTMRPPSRSRLQPPLARSTISSHSSSRAKMVHAVAPILPSYNYCGNLAHKVSECNTPFWGSLLRLLWERGTPGSCLFLPSSRNESNSDYHGKIFQHLSLPLNQKPKHVSLPLKLSPPRVIIIWMLKRKNTMLTKRRCFKPMLLKFNLCKMNLNHWGPNLLI